MLGIFPFEHLLLLLFSYTAPMINAVLVMLLNKWQAFSWFHGFQYLMLDMKGLKLCEIASWVNFWVRFKEILQSNSGHFAFSLAMK
jgi:hypothetical protein